MDRLRVGMIEGRHPLPVTSYLISATEAATLTVWEMAAIAGTRAAGLASADRRLEVFITGLSPVLEAVVESLTVTSERAAQHSNRYAGHALFHYDKDCGRYRTVAGEWADPPHVAAPA